jgi:hypothetical protein
MLRPVRWAQPVRHSLTHLHATQVRFFGRNPTAFLPLKTSCPHSVAPDGKALAQRIYRAMIRKLKSGEYRLLSRKKSPETGRRRNLGTFKTLEQAKQHEREVQYFKRH